MKSIRKQNCILAIVMFALMSILTSFPICFLQNLKHKTKYRHTEYLFSMAEQQTLQLIYTLFLYKNYEQTYSAS